MHLTRRDCTRLGAYARAEIKSAGARATRLRVSASPSAPLSSCSYSAGDAQLSITLDTATDSHQRFSNRLVEAIQFSFDDPSKRPRRVNGVGDPGAESGGAVWTTSSAQLTAIRGDRLLIVGFYVAGIPDRRLRAEAAALARRAYAIISSEGS